ncbi:PREDICTED: zinc finger protein 37 homolog isoform X1 [Papilio polytes]|uniref:zinc finger protein 37 homolog isoform X1 n=1 Tax=Papilio polytes TaxID=76194 RepID=UPI000675EE60|nr:PREDICTED: zinc finger protein 37 homolog isoform X1 [Papilio polytes]
MDLIWSKDRLLKIFSTESVMVHANATGDCGSVPVLCCHLCGGDSDLRRFRGTYNWNGIEEQYDLMLNECFGVEVPRLDCMICENCIHQLRNAKRFRNMVNAAFVKPQSESQMSNGSKTTFHKMFSNTKFDSEFICPKKETTKDSKPKSTTDHDKKRPEKRRYIETNVKTKKANVSCSVCNQRYPMIVPFEGVKKFICSRCKKNAETYGVCKKCNMRLPMSQMSEHMKTHAKTKLKGRNKLSTGAKIMPSLSKTDNLSRTQTYVKYPKKYQCSHCPKKYIVPKHLAHHINTVHGEILDCTCTVCGKDLKTRELLDKHMRSHTGQPIFQCQKCMKIFKSQRSLQSHFLTHQKC